MDLSNKTDRQLLEEIYLGLFNKQSPFDRDDDAPDPVQPVEGFDRVFGPRPHPSDSTNGSVWRREAAKVTKVYENVPDKYEAGALRLASETGVVAVFLEYAGQTKACIRPGLPPKLWLVDAQNFVGANIEGLLRSVKDAK